MAMELFGVKRYSIEYEGEIEYIKSGIEKSFLEDIVSFREMEAPPPPMGLAGQPMFWEMNITVKNRFRKRGERRQISGSVIFDKAERGWRYESGGIYDRDE